MKKMLMGLMIVAAGQQVNATVAVGKMADGKVILVDPRLALTALGAAVGFGVNIVSDKYVQPNIAGLSVVVPVCMVMQAAGNKNTGYALVGYTAGATAAKSVWAVINCIKRKASAVWNS